MRNTYTIPTNALNSKPGRNLIIEISSLTKMFDIDVDYGSWTSPIRIISNEENNEEFEQFLNDMEIKFYKN